MIELIELERRHAELKSEVNALEHAFEILRQTGKSDPSRPFYLIVEKAVAVIERELTITKSQTDQVAHQPSIALQRVKAILQTML